MPIETLCQTCNNRLRVADEHAGKLARCPKCQSVYRVPQPAGSAEATSSAGSPATSDQWRLKTADGAVYGPVSRADMDRWLAEGRVTADSQLLQEGSEKWRWAGEIYPQLASTTFGGAAAAGGTASSLSSSYAPTASGYGGSYGVSPFARPSTPSSPGGAANPFSDSAAAPAAYGGSGYGPAMSPMGHYYKPHRGALILILGILSIAVCTPLGIPAALMGMADLKAISNGTMDPSGKGLTMAGMIMGWVGTGIFAVTMLFMLFLFVASLS